MNKLLKFKYTKDGMIVNPERALNTDGYAEFVSVNELLGVLNEFINEKLRVLENYQNLTEDDAWRKERKAVYEAQKEELERVRKLLY